MMTTMRSRPSEGNVPTPCANCAPVRNKITPNTAEPFGVLFALGAAVLVCGLHSKTPFPVQPMKAIGAVASVQAVQTAVVTPAAALRRSAAWARCY